ncbi:hypothetical protein [Streptomyces sp. NPDC094032]|uniref:hypothetical protein n=1 Tax=Streptomyces sp. NPDC094032 TaxID=3155308 RepID=UPI003328AE18
MTKRSSSGARFLRGALAVAALAGALTVPMASPASAATDPGCGGEWTDYNGGGDRRMKSWLCVEHSPESGRLIPQLWAECGWQALGGIGWQAPPNGCRVWEPSTYKLTKPDGTVSEHDFPATMGSEKFVSNSEWESSCQPGTWKLWSYYGVQMKDVLGNWGSNVAATHEYSFTVTCS